MLWKGAVELKKQNKKQKTKKQKQTDKTKQKPLTSTFKQWM